MLESPHQVFNCQHQFAAQFNRVFRAGQINRFAHGLGVTLDQCQLFIVLTKSLQQPAHLCHPASGFGNGFQRRFRFQFTGLDAFQQTTFKRPAIRGPFRINPAQRAAKTGARLGKSLFTALLFQRQSKFGQLSGVIALLQLHVGKQNAVAAQAALRTELGNKIIHRHKCFGYFRCNSDLMRG